MQRYHLYKFRASEEVMCNHLDLTQTSSGASSGASRHVKVQAEKERAYDPWAHVLPDACMMPMIR